MRLSTAVAFALSTLLVAVTVGTVGVAPAMATTDAAGSSAGSSGPTQSTMTPLEPSIQSTDGSEYRPERADPWQVIRLNVTDDGDVRWTIESRFVIADNETGEFESYAQAVVDGDRDVGYDVDQYDQFREQAERQTGREMAFENESWEEPRTEPLEGADGDSGDRNLGVIAYSFTWTNFATVEDDEINFGDAFITEDGVWLSFLEEGQRFVVESPPNYGFDTAPAKVEGGTIVYDGYTSLEEDDFEMVFLRSSSPSTPGNTTPSDPEPEPREGSNSSLSAERVGAAFGGFVLLLVAASLVISRYQRSEWPFDGTDDDEPPVAPARSPETDGSGATAVDSGVEHEFDETEAVSGEESGEANDEEIDVDLLSDEERVRRLLEHNGGRMKQATIVSETGWSDAKVSQLLSEMDDEDEIEKLRIGRENLITLPDVDPTEID